MDVVPDVDVDLMTLTLNNSDWPINVALIALTAMLLDITGHPMHSWLAHLGPVPMVSLPLLLRVAATIAGNSSLMTLKWRHRAQIALIMRTQTRTKNN